MKANKTPITHARQLCTGGYFQTCITYTRTLEDFIDSMLIDGAGGVYLCRIIDERHPEGVDTLFTVWTPEARTYGLTVAEWVSGCVSYLAGTFGLSSDRR